MALNLTGIENVEFYSGHYLDSVLEGDVKGLFDDWKKAADEHGTKPPFDRLTGPATAWEKARRAASGEPDTVDRWRAARGFHAELLEALGYDYQPGAAALEDGTELPLVASVDRNGAPYLWVVDTGFVQGEDQDALDAEPLIQQIPGAEPSEKLRRLPASEDPERKGARATWRELLDRAVFRLEHSPRWILFLSGDELVLAEQHKWPQGRLLRFDLATLLSRKEKSALRAFCVLVHRDALAPSDGGCLHDSLEEKSHKHAFAVSGDLKHGVRRAIEILGNEAIRYRTVVQKRSIYDDPKLADKLKSDCLTYMYRLLFLLYVEARGAELGVVPMRSEAYREGYSVESLRDLELVPLTTDDARNGFYLDHSLKTLFRIVNEGFFEDGEADLYSSTEEEVMRVQGLRSPLFDDDRLQVLKGIRFRNLVLQEVVQLLSLSREKGNKSRGRISYAQLGISQLGSVYESLLSYTGFFADDPDGLYEVASKADVKKIEDARSGKGSAEDAAIHYVPASQVDLYDDAEFVRDEHGRRIKHERGTFIYTLAGRSREKSASFYTPEVLTECVVKYALKELLEDEHGQRKLTADEILDLTVLEPAMGSGAFLIEGIDQLADAYLEARQDERDELIPSEQYPAEKRRVKARLATNNVHGVDFNATAVELAKTSLWLGAMAEDTKCPWFGLRLAHGNSLIGARREVFRTADVTRKGTKGEPNWLGLAPEPVPLFDGTARVTLGDDWRAPRRPEKTIYHFLLPADGMAPFDKDQVVKALEPKHAERIKVWRKEFTKPLKPAEAARLEKLSDAVDRLFAEVARERQLVASATTDRIPVWGEDGRYDSGSKDSIQVRDQEEAAAALEDASSAYRRLRLVMDAWCALWFWPIDRAQFLPDREEWLRILELLLLGEVRAPEQLVQQELFETVIVQRSLPLGASETIPASATVSSPEVGEEGADAAARRRRLRELSEAFAERRRGFAASCGHADTDDLLEASPFLRIVGHVRGTAAFHHWELRFAEVFASRGGFDLILGNPPWIRITWQEGGVLSEFEPLLSLRKQSASNIARQRERLLGDGQVRAAYFGEFQELEATQAFLNAVQNEPLLRGMHTNLYKCFITRAWTVGSPQGVAGYLHPEGVYDDPKGGALRRELYPRLALHAQFQNVFSLFDTNDHGLLKFGINVYGVAGRERRSSLTMSSVFHPRTLDASYGHDGHGEVPGIKLDGSWDLRGHRSRLVTVDEDTLALFATLYDKPGTDPLEARLPVVHSEEIVQVLRRFAEQPRKLGDMKGEYFADGMFHETEAQKDGTIRRDDQKHSVQPASTDQWILQGPHFHVGTPFNKTPNEVCASNGAWTSLDLTAIPDDYLPRTNYVPACDAAEYLARTPKWNGKPVTEFYRHVHRRFVSPTGERTLAAALFPPGPGHVNVVSSTVSSDLDFLTLLCGVTSALPADFLIKTTGTGNLYDSVLQVVPVPEKHPLEAELAGRVLNLNCLTEKYENLWSSTSGTRKAATRSVLGDRRVRTQVVEDRQESVLRTDLERRNALVEIDVLTSIMINIDVDQLSLLYRVQFPVLQQYEHERRYDQHGRIVPTSTTAAGQPAVSLVKLGALLAEQAGFDPSRAYAPGDPDTEALLASKVKLGNKEAEVLGVPQCCQVGDLMTTCTVRYWDDAPDGTLAPPEGRTIELVALRYTDPGLKPRMERTYPTPWTRCDREDDYRTAWAKFERRLGGSGSEALTAEASLTS